MHDEAIAAIPGTVWKALNTPIPDDHDKKTPMELLRSSITASIDGKIGTYFRDLGPGLQQAADPQGALLSKMMDIFAGSSKKKK